MSLESRIQKPLLRCCVWGNKGLYVSNMRRKLSFHGVKTELESDHKALWQRKTAL